MLKEYLPSSDETKNAILTATIGGGLLSIPLSFFSVTKHGPIGTFAGIFVFALFFCLSSSLEKKSHLWSTISMIVGFFILYTVVIK